MSTPARPTSPQRRRLRASGDQSVTFVELFFDLVFVFAITQITKVVVDDLSVAGAAEALLVFWMIWWAWTQFTWALNPADTTHGAVRVGTLLATAAGFLLAVSVPGAFEASGFWFAVPYVAVRLLGLGIYLAVATGSPDHLAAVRSFALRSTPPLLLVLVGAALPSPARAWVWLAVVLLDLLAVGRAGGDQQWDLRPGHFAERHGLFVIIALGESLIVAGQSVLRTESSTVLLAVAVGAVAVTGLLWWLYFGWWQQAMEHQLTRRTGADQSRLARDAYTLLHFPLVAGIIAIAAGVEEMVLHPDDPLPTAVRLALATGLLLYLAATDLAWWRATRRVLPARTAIGLLLAAAVASIQTTALTEVTLVAGALGLLVILEHLSPATRARPAVRRRDDPRDTSEHSRGGS